MESERGDRNRKRRHKKVRRRTQQGNQVEGVHQKGLEEIQDIGIKLVGEVVAYLYTPVGATTTQALEIGRGRDCDPQTNIIAKLDGIRNGWGGNIDNSTAS
jgi:hypothetical protein